MPFLTLNELTIPISTKSGTETLTPLGASGRTLDATLRENAEDTKRMYSFRTTPQVQVNGEGLKRLLNSVLSGFHASWNVDFFTDGKGLPAAVTGAPVISAAGPKFGAGRLLLTAADRLTYAAELPTKFTVMWHVNPGGGYVHRARVFDGVATTLYEDGVVAAGPFPEVTVSAGSVVVGDLVSAFTLDDLVILPFEAASEWLTGDWGVVTQAWSNPPALIANGTMVDDEDLIVKPRVGKITWRPFQDQAAAAWADGGQVIEFVLEEV